MTTDNKLQYTMTMLKVIDRNLDYLIEVAEEYGYEDTFIEWLKEMKDDVEGIKEVIEWQYKQ